MNDMGNGCKVDENDCKHYGPPKHDPFGKCGCKHPSTTESLDCPLTDEQVKKIKKSKGDYEELLYV